MTIQYVPQGGEFRVNTYTSVDQSEPSITSLVDGGFVVTWMSNDQDGSGWDVYGQVYGDDGSPVGGEFRVNTYTGSAQRDPSITSLASGGFVITWASDGQDGYGYGVYGQVYGGDGSRVGSEFRVNAYTASSQYYPSITGLADGGFVATWTSYGQDGSDYGVYGQIYDTDGSPVGGEFRVNTYTGSAQRDPSITSLAGGGFVITWTSDGQDSWGYGIYGQAYNDDGSLVGGEFRVNTYTVGEQSHPSITSLADGGFVVSWGSVGQDGTGYGVYGQVYGGNGSPVGSEFRLNTYTTGDEGPPSIASLAGGGFVATWVSSAQDGDGYGIYGQIFDSEGSPVGGEFRVNTYTTRSQLSPATTSLADGGFVVTWFSSWGQDGSGDGIYAQRFSPHYNSDPSGIPNISGTARQGQTLSASVGSITDEDGINGSTATYQWLRNGSIISGATASSYQLTQAVTCPPVVPRS